MVIQVDEPVRVKPNQTGRAAAILRLNGNEALYNELLEMFFKDDAVECLHGYLASGDVKSALLTAHGMKGSAANLGLETLSDLAGNVERSLRDNDVAAAQEAFSKLQREFDTISFFQE